jgi:RHS repeat-associated protein
MARLRFACLIVLSLVSYLVFLPLFAYAQQDPAVAHGLKPYGTYNGGDIDLVSVENGKLDLHAPLASYPQRGALSMNFTIRYWAPSYEVDKDCEPGNPPPACQFITSASVVGVYVSPDFFQVGTSGQAYTDANGKVLGTVYSVTTPDGGAHPLGATSSTVFESVDATGFRWDKTANVITDKDGIRYSVAPNGVVQDNSVEDTNGNKVIVASGGYIDTLGRIIPAVPSIFGASGGTISRCPTGALTVFEAFDWVVPGPSGTSETYTFCYVQKPLNVNLHVGAHSVGDTHSPTMLQSIVLPNGQFWNFTYGDQYGNLTQVILPTGGTISYSPGIAQMCFVGSIFPQTYFSSVGTRSINANDGRGAATWTYSGSLASSNTTVPQIRTVTDPLGNQDVYTMSPLGNTCSFFETQIQKYQGSSSTGTLLETTSTAYSYTLNINDNSARKSVVNVVPTTVTTTWPNGKAKQTLYSYDSGFAYSGPGGNSTGIYGNHSIESDYDYGVGSAGSILKEIFTNYLAFSNSSYLNLNLLNLVSSQKVTDGSGTTRAYTTYGYDQSSPISSGVTMQHDGAPPTGSTRGNQTSVLRWLNTIGGNLTSSKTFYDTGMVHTSVDPLLNTTTYTYSSGFYGAYPTETQLPVTNSVQHNTFANYDFNTGLTVSTTDQNGNTTGYTYDSMSRIKTVTPPSVAGVTTFNYNDMPGALSVEKTQQIDSSRSTDEFVNFDGLGRQVSQSTANDESVPWDKVDTCYDPRGLKSFVSYPYQSSSENTAPVCSGAGDAYGYDALSRATSITHSDGSSATTSYTGAATSVLDEGNGTVQEQHVTQEDGLGRTISACEVTSATVIGTTGTPAACGQDIAATGFLTTYQYDTLGNLIGVSQGGLNPRTFIYDSLSRLTTDTNPETGTTSYAYDADSNVYQRTRPAPNQTSGTVTTTYSYDALNRVTQTSYSDGTTPIVNDYYDETSIYGVTLSNTTGRLSRTLVNNSSYAYTLRSYDAVGRVTNNWQDTPDLGGNSKLLSYGYDLVGDPTSATNGLGTTIGYSYNRATRMGGSTSSLSTGNYPGTLLSAVHYNAFGSLLSATYGNGVTETRSYDGRGRLMQQNDIGTIPQAATAGSTSVTLSFNEQSNGTSANGTVSVGGSEQNKSKPNTPGTGNSIIGGSEQSKQIQTQGPAPGTASFTMSGSSQTIMVNHCPPPQNCPTPMTNSGTISVIINGITFNTGYGSTNDTAASVAANLTASLNGTSGSPVTATQSGSTITVTARTSGAATNYAVSTSSSWNTSFFSQPSFTLSASSLTGGHDAVNTTVYDTGTVTVAVNGYSKTESYAQSTTTSSLASALASDFTNDGSSPVTASASGATVNFTSRQLGSTTNYSLSCSSGTNNGNFSSASFSCSPSGSTLTGGANVTVYDSGTVKVIVNGGTASASFGQSSTTTSVAQALASSLNAITATTNVTASSSGSTISLQTTTTGSASNYPLSTSVTYDSGDFSSASFSGTPSGSALTGGANPNGAGAVYDSGTITLTVNSSPVVSSTASYGQGDTADTIATKLAQNLPSNSAVSVSKNGTGTLTITALQTGSSTNYTYSFSQTHSSSFSSPSFTGPSSGALANGTNPTFTPATTYSFTLGLAPNGDLLTGNDSINGNWTYTYDPMNRVVTSSKPGQAFSYVYDRFGNRWQQNVTAGTGPQPNYSFDTNNRLIGMTYDAAGNVINDVSHNYIYDAENRIIKVDNGNTAIYAYDGEGRRMWKSSGAGNVDYLYDLGGHQIAELSSAGAWNRGEVYAGSTHLATYYASTIYFPLSDWLATERVRSDTNATNCETITNLVYGDAQAMSGTCGDPSPLHFTGKMRDAETGLDDFPARYYSSTQGRWYSPDWSPVPVAIPYADLANPQTLNLYDYVGGDPTNHADADGHEQAGVGSNQYDAVHKHAFGANDGQAQSESQEKSQVQSGVQTVVTDLDRTTKPVQPLAKELQKLPDVDVNASATLAGVNKSTDGSTSFTPAAIGASVDVKVTLVKDPSKEIGDVEVGLSKHTSVNGSLVLNSDGKPRPGSVGASVGLAWPETGRVSGSLSQSTFHAIVDWFGSALRNYPPAPGI